MGYSLYFQIFLNRECGTTPYGEVIAILSKFGNVWEGEGRIEFTPDANDICEVGFITRKREDGVSGISLVRPQKGWRLPALIFDLLSIPGLCFYELDCTYVLARSDVTEHVPKKLLDLCPDRRVTVITSPYEISL